MGEASAKFTPEMLKLLAGTQSNAKVAKKLGVERFTVRNWRTQTKNTKRHSHSIWKNMKIRGSELFSRNKFYRHLERACEKAGVKNFCPYSFRHKVGQEVRDQHGIRSRLCPSRTQAAQHPRFTLRRRQCWHKTLPNFVLYLPIPPTVTNRVTNIRSCYTP